MRHLLFLVVAASCVSHSIATHPICPEGLQPWFNGVCGIRIDSSSFTYESALSLCHEMGAFLPSIKNSQENEHLRIAANGSTIIIGILKNECKWDDGSKIEYINYRSMSKCSDRFAGTLMNPVDGLWDELALYVVDTLICTAPPKFDDRCSDFTSVDASTSTCFDVHAEKMTWNEAKDVCAKDDANLAVIYSSEVNSFIRRAALAQGISTSVHIGLTSIDGGRDFTWPDGSELIYKNVAPGFPIPDFGSCGAMQIQHPLGKWMNERCDSQSMPFVCTRSVADPVDETCPEKYLYKSGDDIFSPGFPARYSATACDYMVVADAGSKIRVEVLQFAVNTCCAALTISDGVFGDDQMAVLTGEQPYMNFTSTRSSVRISWNSTEQGELLGWHLRVFVE